MTDYYLIKEESGSVGGVDYDTTHYLVKVVITDDDEGSLEAAVTYYVYDAEADPPAWVEYEGDVAFTNSYGAEDVDVELGGTKTLTGRNVPLEDKEFEFGLYKSDVDGSLIAQIETVENDLSGSFAFTKLTYEDSEEGIYYYLIKE